MGTFANPTTLFDNSANGPSVETALRLMRANQRAIMELPGAMPAERCEIQGEAVSDGFIEPTRSDIVVALPENYSSTSAVIKSISNSYTNENTVTELLHEGMIISLRSEFSGYDIQVVSSTANGGILLKNAESVTLSEKYPLKLKLVNLAGSAYRWEECAESGVHSGDWELVSGDLEVTGLVRSDGIVLQREIVYDTVPIFNTTLAEDTNMYSTEYVIDLSSYQTKRAMLFVTSPIDTVSKGVYVRPYYSGMESYAYQTSLTVSSTSNVYYAKIEFFDNCGFLGCIASRGTNPSGLATAYTLTGLSQNTINIQNQYLDHIGLKLGSSSNNSLLAGTEIQVYVATYRTI